MITRQSFSALPLLTVPLLIAMTAAAAAAPSPASPSPASPSPASQGPASQAPTARAFPPIADYLLPRDVEIAMARSAAPALIADRATVKVLTKAGYEVASQGDNGAVCLVMRGFSAPTYTPAPLRDLVYDPTVHAPICFTAPAARTVLPYYELRTRLGLAGTRPDQIAVAVEAAYARGELPARDGATFAYMFSAHQHLGEVGAWHPHMMVFVPYADATTVGATPFGGTLPTVTDDAGTPFAVVVIAVDEKQFVKRPTN
ncbi:MAG: hypothetical protein ABIT71_22290 [Vicinamibacteraceae bacterium]